MSTIIAIESSSDVASVALLHEGRIHTDAREGFSTHSLHLLPMLQALLAQEGLTVADCDAVAFGCGPGSFTGVRTACGIVQGLSFARQLPVMPVIGLAAMAQTCFEKTGAVDIVSVIDARMHEVYWAQYHLENGHWQVVHAPALSAVSDIVYSGRPVFCGNALTAYADEMKTIVQDAQTFADIMPTALAVLTLGEKAFAQGQTIEASAIEPLYLRNKVALKTSERLALKAQQNHE